MSAPALPLLVGGAVCPISNDPIAHGPPCTLTATRFFVYWSLLLPKAHLPLPLPSSCSKARPQQPSTFLIQSALLCSALLCSALMTHPCSSLLPAAVMPSAGPHLSIQCRRATAASAGMAAGVFRVRRTSHCSSCWGRARRGGHPSRVA